MDRTLAGNTAAEESGREDEEERGVETREKRQRGTSKEEEDAGPPTEESDQKIQFSCKLHVNQGTHAPWKKEERRLVGRPPDTD